MRPVRTFQTGRPSGEKERGSQHQRWDHIGRMNRVPSSSKENMKTLKLSVSLLAFIVVGILSGCSGTSAKSPDVSDSIRTSLDQAGLKDVSISQDRDKGVVTLSGHVTGDADKSQAEAIARNSAGKQVVADQIA